MKPLSHCINPNGILGQYLAIPPDKRNAWLESQEWFAALPTDKKCQCQFCGDTGHVIDENGRARDCGCVHGLRPQATAEETSKYISLHDYLSLQGIWEGWPVWDFAEFEKQPKFQATKCHAAGKRLVHTIEHGGNAALVMIGQSGRGKTYAGLQVLSAAAKLGKNACAFRWDEMIGWMQKGSQNDGEYQKKLSRRSAFIRKLEVVLIDEIGRGENSNPDHARNLMNWIVRDCYRQRSLILTSNMTPHEFDGYLDASIMSRLDGWGEKVYEEIGTQDLRAT